MISIVKRFRNSTGILILLAGLLLSAPLAFWTVIESGMPMGYAGMFGLMAEQIAAANFVLPMDVPYYGPGGLPFAYPPLGLYLLALCIKLTGKIFVFLRLLPPFLSVLALIPLYYLTLELSKSKLAGFVAVLLAAASVELHIPHAWAAGIVRAPAFGFSLLCIFLFQRSVTGSAWRNVWLSGVAFGATILTHLHYALFAALWIALWVLTHPQIKHFVTALQIALVGTVVAAPWLALMFSRYGYSVFFGAFNSHGNVALLSIFERLAQWPAQIWQGILPVLNDVPFSVLAGVGMVTLVGKRRFWLPLFFLASFLLFTDGARFSVTIGCVLAGFGAHEFIALSEKTPRLMQRRAAVAFAWSSILVLLGLAWTQGADRINNFSPRLFSDGLNAGDFFQRETPPTATYLALTPQDEAEWLPYLFKREPLVAQWGSEWLGTYDQQTIAMLWVRSCQNEQDFECLKVFFGDLGREPDYLVSLQRDKRMNQQIAVGDWKLVYQNMRYAVWRNTQP